MGETASGAAPLRRTRPRDRKAQILTAASELFYRSGYHNVSTEEIASAVGITAGALYRHFRTKRELLASAVADRLELATDVIEHQGEGGLESLVGGLAETASGRRELGVLWSRESRHLDDRERTELRAKLTAFLAEFAASLGRLRPELDERGAELLAWCVLSTLTSASYHRTAISTDRMERLLREMAMAVATVPLDARPPAGRAPAVRVPAVAPSRKEGLLSAAATLFDARGYQTVTLDDIGAAVGVGGTTVYRHFASKAELLGAIVARAAEPLQLGLSRALAAADSPSEALRGTVEAYIGFAMVHHDLLGVMIAEVMNLPEPQRSNLRRAQHAYVGEWFRLLGLTRPELDRVEVRFRCHAVLTLVNDTTRTPHLRRLLGGSDDLSTISMRLLLD